MKIKLKPYNKNYPKYFQKEKRILAKIGKFEIHHVGSTAIPDMAGKGIIDILIILNDNRRRKVLTKKLKEIEYVKAKVKDKNRLFFSRKRGKQEYNLRLVIKNYKRARDQIKFRDYLIKNPEEAKRYLKLKKENLRKSKGDRVAYRKLKGAYFKAMYYGKNKKN